MVAVRGTGQEGYLAIDDVEFFPDYDPNECKIMPTEADPTSTTTTTTSTTTATVTEPDQSKQTATAAAYVNNLKFAQMIIMKT